VPPAEIARSGTLLERIEIQAAAAEQFARPLERHPAATDG